MPRRAYPYDERFIEQYVLAEIREHGVVGFSVRRIAERLRVSLGALYHRYPSRERLFLCAYEAFLRRARAELNQELAGYSAGAPFTSLWGALERLLLASDDGLTFLELERARRSFQASEHVRDAPDFVGEWVARHRGELGPAPPALHAWVLWSMFLACAPAPRNTQPDSALLAAVGDACWAALKAAPGDRTPHAWPPEPRWDPELGDWEGS